MAMAMKTKITILVERRKNVDGLRTNQIKSTDAIASPPMMIHVCVRNTKIDRLEFFIFSIVSVAFKWTMGIKHIDHPWNSCLQQSAFNKKSKKSWELKPTSNDGKYLQRWTNTYQNLQLKHQRVRAKASADGHDHDDDAAAAMKMINFSLWDWNSACDKGMSSTKRNIHTTILSAQSTEKCIVFDHISVHLEI